MLPVLLHRVANATQYLNGLSALLAADPGALAARGSDLAVTSEQIDETGWLLALVASASGARLLLARRERAGLSPLVACVRECLRRDGRDLAETDGSSADLAPGVADGWQLPWAVATLLHEAGRSLPPHATVSWSIVDGGDRSRVACSVSSGADLSRFERWLARELPAARLEVDGGAAALELPAGWLVASRSGP